MKKFFVFLLLIFSGIVLYNFVAYRLQDFQAGDLGLGIATTSHEVYWDSLQINQTEGNYQLILPAFKKSKAERKEVILLSGNSQLHAINYFKPGDNLAVYHLNDLSIKSGRHWSFLQLSSPNINFMEMLIYYMSLREQGLKPDWMIISATYRSFQLASLRTAFVENLTGINFEKQGLDKNIERVYREELKNRKKIDSTKTKNNQEVIENYITNFMEHHWDVYQFRGNVQSGIRTDHYEIRITKDSNGTPLGTR